MTGEERREKYKAEELEKYRNSETLDYFSVQKITYNHLHKLCEKNYVNRLEIILRIVNDIT